MKLQLDDLWNTFMMVISSQCTNPLAARICTDRIKHSSAMDIASRILMRYFLSRLVLSKLHPIHHTPHSLRSIGASRSCFSCCRRQWFCSIFCVSEVFPEVFLTIIPRPLAALILLMPALKSPSDRVYWTRNYIRTTEQWPTIKISQLKNCWWILVHEPDDKRTGTLSYWFTADDWRQINAAAVKNAAPSTKFF